MNFWTSVIPCWLLHHERSVSLIITEWNETSISENINTEFRLFYSSGSFIAGENTFTSLTCKARPLFTSSLLPIIEYLCVDSVITQFMSHFTAFVLFKLDENQRLPCFAVNYNALGFTLFRSISPHIWSAFQSRWSHLVGFSHVVSLRSHFPGFAGDHQPGWGRAKRSGSFTGERYLCWSRFNISKGFLWIYVAINKLVEILKLITVIILNKDICLIFQLSLFIKHQFTSEVISRHYKCRKTLKPKQKYNYLWLLYSNLLR